MSASIGTGHEFRAYCGMCRVVVVATTDLSVFATLWLRHLADHDKAEAMERQAELREAPDASWLQVEKSETHRDIVTGLDEQ